MMLTITPDEYIPSLATVEVVVNGIRATTTCHPDDAERVRDELKAMILNQEET